MEELVSIFDFFEKKFDNDETCEDALNLLQDDEWLKTQGWHRVFHEGIGEGIASVTEGVVVIFDTDDVPDFHSYTLYEYNPNAWVSTEDWDSIYDGNDGSNFKVKKFKFNRATKTQWIHNLLKECQIITLSFLNFDVITYDKETDKCVITLFVGEDNYEIKELDELTTKEFNALYTDLKQDF